MESAQTSKDEKLAGAWTVGESPTSGPPSVIQRKPLLPKRQLTLDEAPEPPKHAYTRSQPVGIERRLTVERKPLNANSRRLGQEFDVPSLWSANPPSRPISSDLEGIFNTRRKPIGNYSEMPRQGLNSSLAGKGNLQFEPLVEGILNTKQEQIGDTDQQLSTLPGVVPPLPARKLLGPRSLEVRPFTANLSQFAGQENTKPRRWSEQPALSNQALMIPPRPGLTPDHSSRLNAPRLTAIMGERGVADDQLDHIITLIRRDPSSGGQWNVGKLHIGSSSNFNTDIEPQIQQPQSPGLQDEVHIDITAPGYFKFDEFEKDPNLNLERDRSNPKPFTNKNQRPLRSFHSQPIFHRELFIKSFKQFNVSQASRKNNLRSRIEFRHSSDFSTNSSDFASRSSVSSPEPSRSLPRAYCFLSPWKGICEFTTGISGRSLKCRHTLQSTSSESVTVSELRFNLPSSNAFGKASSKRPTLSTQSRLSRDSSILSSQRHRSSYSGNPSQPSSFDLDDQEHSDSDLDEPMDLSLGQERPGGGLRGRQAKLGKLIIEDEGLKMLDLLVAANMGVWWGVYGRNGG